MSGQEDSKILTINGVKTDELVENYDTPIYVYDFDKIKSQYRKLENAYSKKHDNFSLKYAVKSNFNPEIVQTLVDEGATLDCASKAEIKLAKELGVDEILYTAPYNRKDELEYALEQGATLNLDSIFLLEKLDKIPEEICFRIDPGIGKGDFGLVLGGGDNKFGIPEERAVKAYRKAKEKGVEKFGIHMMTGSNVKDPEYFGQITEKLLEIAGHISEELDIEFEFVDIGGGLGVAYEPSEEPLDVEKTAENVTEKFKEGVKKHDIGNPELLMEPGRYYVAEAGTLLTKVTGVKEKGGTEFVGIDTGMHHNIRPMLLDAYHEIELANDLEREIEGEKNVVGPVCSTTDVMAENRELPKIERGDILAIRDIGAYGFTMASHWNSRPLPTEVKLMSGKHEVIREKEEISCILHGTKLDKN